MRQDLQLTVAEAVHATGAELLSGRPQGLLGGVCSDTRLLQPGDLYFAIKGERFDGVDYVSQALAAGASGLVIPAHALPRLPTLELGERAVPILAVPDTRAALGRLAHWHRRRFGVQLAAVTGSNGKTGTKELVGAALALAGPTLKTSGNLNNDIGLPFTLLQLRPEHRFAVLELGMNAPGEIAYLAGLALPRIGVITCVAAAHTEGLGSIEGVAAAKGELFEALRPDGVAVVNLDDPHVVAQARRTSAPVLTFGTSAGADVRVVQASSGAGPLGTGGASGILEVGGRLLPVQLKLLGRHNLLNAAAALAVCRAFDLEPEPCLLAMGRVLPAPHRLAVQRLLGLTVIDDCYNANPGSMVAALDTLEALAAEAIGHARKIAILGEMRELGAESLRLHQQVGRHAGRIGLELLITVGREAEALGEEARRTGGVKRWVHQEEAGEVAELLLERSRPGDLVLLKGSRRVGLERVLDGLRRGEVH